MGEVLEAVSDNAYIPPRRETETEREIRGALGLYRHPRGKG